LLLRLEPVATADEDGPEKRLVGNRVMLDIFSLASFKNCH
jgi:hypothetical protein